MLIKLFLHIFKLKKMKVKKETKFEIFVPRGSFLHAVLFPWIFKMNDLMSRILAVEAFLFFFFQN